MSSDSSLPDKGVAGAGASLSSDKMRTLSLDGVGSEKSQSSSGVFSKKKSCLITTVMLVWLESFEDYLNFPTSKTTLFYIFSI